MISSIKNFFSELNWTDGWGAIGTGTAVTIYASPKVKKRLASKPAQHTKPMRKNVSEIGVSRIESSGPRVQDLQYSPEADIELKEFYQMKTALKIKKYHLKKTIDTPIAEKMLISSGVDSGFLHNQEYKKLTNSKQNANSSNASSYPPFACISNKWDYKINKKDSLVANSVSIPEYFPVVNDQPYQSGIGIDILIFGFSAGLYGLIISRVRNTSWFQKFFGPSICSVDKKLDTVLNNQDQFFEIQNKTSNVQQQFDLLNQQSDLLHSILEKLEESKK